jgi:hypothetical protein
MKKQILCLGVTVVALLFVAGKKKGMDALESSEANAQVVPDSNMRIIGSRRFCYDDFNAVYLNHVTSKGC